MDLKISHLIFVIVIFSSSAMSLRCYTCNSLRDKNHECEMLTNIEPMNCSTPMLRKLENLPFPDELSSIFEFDENTNIMAHPDFTCVQIRISPTNGFTSTPKRNYVVRTCQIVPKYDKPHFCDAAKNKLKDSDDHQIYKIDDCSECDGDACNGATSINISIPLLAIFTLVSYLRT